MKSGTHAIIRYYFFTIGAILAVGVIGCSKDSDSGNRGNGVAQTQTESPKPVPTDSGPHSGTTVFEDAKSFLKYLDVSKSQSHSDWFSYNNRVVIISNELVPDPNSDRDLDLTITVLNQSDDHIDFRLSSRCDFKHQTILEHYGVVSILEQNGYFADPVKEYFSLNRDGKIDLHCVPGYGGILSAGEYHEAEMRIEIRRCFSDNNKVNPGSIRISKLNGNRIQVVHQNDNYSLDGRTVTCSAELLSR